MDISIVIPAFNENKKIPQDIRSASDFLLKNNFTGEIIVVDDGSTDNTADVAESVEMPPNITLNVIRSDENRGKGYAVRTGIKSTRGDYVMFADSGNCVPFEDALRGLDMLQNDECEIAHGSRKMTGTHILKAQNLYRRICSRFFHWLMLHFMAIPARFTDTQCGFKIYRGEIGRNLYAQCVTNGFMFDIETIIRAGKSDYRISEFPVDWTNDRDSRLSPIRCSWELMKELILIKHIFIYAAYKNSRK